MQCTWEHVKEHIKNRRNMLGEHVENLGNIIASTKIEKGRRMYLQRRNLPILITTYPWSCQCNFFFMPHVTISCKSHKESRVRRGVNVWRLHPLLWHESFSKLNDILTFLKFSPLVVLSSLKYMNLKLSAP